MKRIVRERADIAFYIKMFPLMSHPEAYDKSMAIVCKKSMRLLERAFAGKEIKKPKDCETTAVDDTIALARELGISSTPTIIFPDGGVTLGYKDSSAIIRMVDDIDRKARERARAEGAGERRGSR